VAGATARAEQAGASLRSSIVEHDGFGKLNTAMHDTMADGSDRRLA